MNNRPWNRAALVAVGMAIALFAAPAVVAANDSGMGGAGMAVRPVTSTTIRMAAETVQVVAFGSFAEYQVDFKFTNKGAPQHVKLGFPFPLPNEMDYVPPAGFRAWKGNKQLTVTYQEIGKVGARLGYYLHEADFPTGTTMIRVRYYACPDGGILGDLPPGVEPPARFAGWTTFWGAYPYTVSTGAGWAGTIGKSVIRYYVSPDALLWGVDEAAKSRAADLTTDEQPDYARWLLAYTTPTPGVYQWEFTDFEPRPDADGTSAYDIRLPFYVPVSEESASAKASSELTLGDSSYPADQAIDGDPSSAWAESAAGPGTGQWLLVTFTKAQRTREIRVLPGYAKTESLFRKYNRPRTLLVEFSDGTSTKLTLTDDPDVQRFPIDVTAKWAKVTIGGVFRGTTRDETYLSEIEFATARAPELMAFQDVLDGKLPESAETSAPSVTATPATDAIAVRPLPDKPSDLNWPLVIVAGVLALLIVGGLALLARRRAKHARASEPSVASHTEESD